MPTLSYSAEGNTGGCDIASTRWTCEVKDPRHAWNLHAREPGDPISVRHEAVSGPVEEGDEPKSRHERCWGIGRSCSTCEVPEQRWKSLTGGGLEGRRPTKENTGQLAASQMQSWGNALAGLRRVREAAKREKRLRFTALLHHVSVALLTNSFYALKRGAAPGVDGLTWQEYETDLDKRLEDLHSRVHRGTYRALPSKRAYIPKPDGRQRPLGIAALEDKIVQHAVGTVLNQIYEEDFLGFSYGFRPGRNTHGALDALSVGIMRKKVNWVLDADIRDCFGSFSHEWMEKFIQRRIGDRRILRLIEEWLRAGVLEDGEWSETEKGTPQGSEISPLLCNVYLHYVFDLWVQHWRKHRAAGEVIVVRYADDSVLGFQHRADAERFLL